MMVDFILVEGFLRLRILHRIQNLYLVGRA